MASESGKSAEGFDMIFKIKRKLLCSATCQIWNVHFLAFTITSIKFLVSIDGLKISHSSHGNNNNKNYADVFKCSVGSGIFLQCKV